MPHGCLAAALPNATIGRLIQEHERPTLACKQHAQTGQNHCKQRAQKPRPLDARLARMGTNHTELLCHAVAIYQGGCAPGRQQSTLPNEKMPQVSSKARSQPVLLEPVITAPSILSLSIRALPARGHQLSSRLPFQPLTVRGHQLSTTCSRPSQSPSTTD